MSESQNDVLGKDFISQFMAHHISPSAGPQQSQYYQQIQMESKETKKNCYEIFFLSIYTCQHKHKTHMLNNVFVQLRLLKQL